MNSVERMQSAITMVEDARSVPLSASCVLHRAELLAILVEARNSFPQDFEYAQQILIQRDVILEEARQGADAMMVHGREEVAQMIEQTQIVAAARTEAARIMAEVSGEANKQREEIETYIDSRLATLEVILNKTLDAVNRGRDKLKGVDDKNVLSELRD